MKKYLFLLLFAIACNWQPNQPAHQRSNFISNVKDSAIVHQYKMYKVSDSVTIGNRDGTRTIQIGNSLFSIGGWTANPVSKSYNDVYKSSDSLHKWVSVGNAPFTGRHTFGLDRLSDKVFVYGSDAQNPVMDMWLTFDGATWYKQPDMPMKQRSLFGSCSTGAYIVMVGGMDNINNFRSKAHDVWIFDGNDWQKMGNGLAAFEKNLSGAVCYFNRRIWVISGGTYGTYTGSQEVYSSGDYGAHWDEEPDIPFAGRYYHNTIVWDGKLWLIGGVGGAGKANLSDIWYMDSNQVWTEFKPPVEFLPRHASGVAIFNDKLVISNGNYHNDCWVIEKL